MSATTAATTSPASQASARAYWERLWRQSGINFVSLFVIGYFIHGNQPHIGASADALTAFYDGHHTRILIAAVFCGLAVLNLMWFAAALRTVLADAGQDGWGAAATASSSAVGALFLMIIATGTALGYSIAHSGNIALVSGLNDLVWALIVLSSFPRAMLIMAGSFGLWRAGLIPNSLFAAGVTAVVLGVAGGTTWVAGGFWAPDGIYSQFVWPIVGLVWLVVFNGVLTKSPATRAAW